jgi:hypothetical protein
METRAQLIARLVGAGRHAHLAFKKGGCCLITFDKFPPKSSRPARLVADPSPDAQDDLSCASLVRGRRDTDRAGG